MIRDYPCDKVTVVVTADPSADIMEAFVEKLVGFTRANGFHVELIIADQLRVLADGFVYKNSKLFERFSLRVLYPTDTSKGGQLSAILEGLRLADGDVAITMDPDMFANIDDIQYFIDKYRCGANMVYGWRVSRSGVSVLRRHLTKIFNALAKSLVDFGINDLNSNMILFSSAALLSLRVLNNGKVSVRLRLSHIYKSSLDQVCIKTVEPVDKVSTYSFFLLVKIGILRVLELFYFWFFIRTHGDKYIA